MCRISGAQARSKGIWSFTLSDYIYAKNDEDIICEPDEDMIDIDEGESEFCACVREGKGNKSSSGIILIRELLPHQGSRCSIIF